MTKPDHFVLDHESLMNQLYATLYADYQLMGQFLRAQSRFNPVDPLRYLHRLVHSEVYAPLRDQVWLSRVAKQPHRWQDLLSKFSQLHRTTDPVRMAYEVSPR